MRADGWPSRVLVASVIAFGSIIPARSACSNHFSNWRMGSGSTSRSVSDSFA